MFNPGFFKQRPFKQGLSRQKSKTILNCLIIAVTALLFTASASASTKPKPRLSMQDAEKIALGRQAGTIKSEDLEKENNRWIYSFDIERDKQIHEVGVDANTGKIVEDKVEDAAAEAREQAQEKRSKKSGSKPK
jgi:uncharacterized membrane protein YkoI